MKTDKETYRGYVLLLAFWSGGTCHGDELLLAQVSGGRPLGDASLSSLLNDKSRIIRDRVQRTKLSNGKHHRVRGQVAPHSSGREIIELRR